MMQFTQVMMRNFEGKNIGIEFCFSVWMSRKMKFFYDISFVFSSTGFDPYFVAYVVAR